ncbi:LysR family transcriptional regulator [Roseibium hamelinense]|uniref:LysR family transcriptional regulator n=1 Tax=Roseibium hamelinense TaxID=150831 RepID=A0A562TH36_9HYPH|nr:LysR family transcriptional regulator [Roseibium hamelinense]MTI43119.1 LysR family transcriptional regulator [Roseibium hamelinense]TWI92534.1 LysR family transcriptional regulator [Roseibium hamelinense]
MLLDNLALFVLINEKGSLTAAARERGLSPTTVSERLSALEAHYGVVLLNRTTRALSLTEEGRTLLEGARRVLSEVADLDGQIKAGAQTLSGPIRISAPSDTGRLVVSDALDRFQQRHPQIKIELHLSDGYVDVVGQGFDLAIRYGEVTDTSLRRRALRPVRRIVCASPAYLADNGEPQRPDDLRAHNCLIMRFGLNLDNLWRFGFGHSAQTIAVRGDRVSNDGALVRQWAVEGGGIAWKSDIDAGPDLAAGRLIEVLGSFSAPSVPLQLLFPPARAQPRRVRALAEHLAKAIDDRVV